MPYPVISILIPFYNTEDYLLRCLESVASQTYSAIEVVVVNDFSSGKSAGGKNAFQIIQEFSKKYADRKNFSVRYYEHEKNEGTFETRRTCFEQSSGTYCCFLDSDDMLLPQSLMSLYEAAQSSGSDITQGTAEVVYGSAVQKELAEERQKKARKIHEGIVDGSSAITDDFLCKQNHSSFLWGKLFLSATVKKAYECIPCFYGSMGEDFLLYYFICQNASRYCGIKKDVYRYDINSGLTSHTVISTIERWERVCSASSVFTVLYAYFKENPPPEQYKIAIQKLCCSYLANNLKQFHSCVAPKIRAQAYAMLCGYWGESFVAKAEKVYNQNIKKP